MIVAAPVTAPLVVVKKSSAKTPLLVVGAISLLVITVLLGFLLKTKGRMASSDEIAQQKLPEVIGETSSPLTAKDAQVAMTTEGSERASTAAAQSQPKLLSLNPNQLPLMRQQKKGNPVEVTGKLKSVELNRSKTVMVLKFEKGRGTAPILGVLYKEDYQDKFSVAEFKPYLGKVIRVQGRSNPDRTKRCRDVLVKRFKDVVLVRR